MNGRPRAPCRNCEELSITLIPNLRNGGPESAGDSAGRLSHISAQSRQLGQPRRGVQGHNLSEGHRGSTRRRRRGFSASSFSPPQRGGGTDPGGHRSALRTARRATRRSPWIVYRGVMSARYRGPPGDAFPMYAATPALFTPSGSDVSLRLADGSPGLGIECPLCHR